MRISDWSSDVCSSDLTCLTRSRSVLFRSVLSESLPTNALTSSATVATRPLTFAAPSGERGRVDGDAPGLVGLGVLLDEARAGVGDRAADVSSPRSVSMSVHRSATPSPRRQPVAASADSPAVRAPLLQVALHGTS